MYFYDSKPLSAAFDLMETAKEDQLAYAAHTPLATNAETRVTGPLHTCPASCCCLINHLHLVYLKKRGRVGVNGPHRFSLKRSNMASPGREKKNPNSGPCPRGPKTAATQRGKTAAGWGVNRPHHFSLKRSNMASPGREKKNEL